MSQNMASPDVMGYGTQVPMTEEQLWLDWYIGLVEAAVPNRTIMIRYECRKLIAENRDVGRNDGKLGAGWGGD